jgi:hypothetical protein
LILQDDYSQGYVFCDLALDHDQRTAIRALMTAMRQWQVIPQVLLFDNGSPFKGTLLTTFCNEICSHRALGGKPSITRLQEQTGNAPADILDQLERYAAYKMGRQRVKMDGSIRVLGRNAQLDIAAHGQNVTMYETLRGLEVKTQEGRWYLFPDYQVFRQLSCTAPWNMPASFSFERCQGSYPRMAVAS